MIDQSHQPKIMSRSKETLNVYIKKQRKMYFVPSATLKWELLVGVIQKCNKVLKAGEWREFRTPRRERRKKRMDACWMNAFHISTTLRNAMFLQYSHRLLV